MTLYRVPQGTSAHVIRKGLEWIPLNFKNWITRAECYFQPEDIIFDPIMAKKTKLPTLQVNLVKHGFWGFQRDGYVLIVHESKIGFAH